jgi:SAM-dependent methyltransferase
MSNKNFQEYSKYYDLLYKDKDYVSEAKYLQELFKKYSIKKSILDLGCGTGIHAELLSQYGFTVEGVEISKEMAKKAIERKIKCTISDISNYKFSTKFDAIISMFHVISYCTDNSKILKTFKNANKHLKKGGKFIFDVWYTPAVYTIGPNIKIKEIENRDLKITRISIPKIDYQNNIVDVNFKMICEEKKNDKKIIYNETHKMRHFGLHEIELIARICKFKLISFEEPFKRNKASSNTWGVLFVLEKL